MNFLLDLGGVEPSIMILGGIFSALLVMLILAIVFGYRHASFKAGYRRGQNEKEWTESVREVATAGDHLAERPDNLVGVMRALLEEDMQETRLHGIVCGWSLYFGAGQRVVWQILQAGIGEGGTEFNEALDTLD